MRKAKEKWTEEQCKGIEENDSKKAYQLVKELTSSKQGRTTTIPGQSTEVSHRRIRYLEEVDRVLFRVVYTRNNRTSQGPPTNQGRRGWGGGGGGGGGGGAGKKGGKKDRSQDGRKKEGRQR